MHSYAIISDVHANLEALYAVLENLEQESYHSLLFLGDSVGYGPDPNRCIELLKEKAAIILAGNHDWAAAGITGTSAFNLYAKEALEWTRDVLRDKNKTFLEKLPLTVALEKDGITIVHSSPGEPDKWHYVADEHDAEKYFRYFKEDLCFLGHSHIPFIVERAHTGTLKFHHSSAEINKRSRYIINAGSVGQPRDGIPHAAYALLHKNRVEIKRVPYDIVVTQEKMRKAGLPEYLIDRISAGR
jgi:predicted phosphodiesterase